MYFIEILAIAVALSMDALAVSVTTGVTLKRPNASQLVRMPAAFGIFQALMPIIGWFLGKSVHQFIEQWDHWVACALLVIVGAKLLHETLSGEDEDAKPVDPTRGWTIVVLAIATSIDALAVGITFAFLQVEIVPAVSFIGVTTFIISVAGVKIGNVFGSRWQKGAQIAGGVILICLGVKILVEHLGLI